MTHTLVKIFLEAAHRVDEKSLVADAASEQGLPRNSRRTHVLAIGKVAFPMFEGLQSALPNSRFASCLIVAPQTRFPADPRLPTGATAIASDHPTPSARSLAAGRAALDFVSAIPATDQLIVLLSGGGSAALVMPAGDLSLEEKLAVTSAVARAGATITELNTVRKHLSAIKGGHLALTTHAPTTVLALSDVVGNDPGTIASGPFSADASTFLDATSVLARLAPHLTGGAVDHLRRGASGALPETAKPGDPSLSHVAYRILAGPDRVVEEACRAAESMGLATGALDRNTEEAVYILAQPGSQGRPRSLRQRNPARRPWLPGARSGHLEPARPALAHGRPPIAPPCPRLID